MVCPKGEGGLSQCGHFSGKGVSIFRDFVQTSFMDGPKLDGESKYLLQNGEKN